MRRLLLILSCLLAGCATEQGRVWQQFDADFFSFSIPPHGRIKELDSVDTAAWALKCPGISIDIGSGQSARNDYPGITSTNYEDVTVDGKQGKLKRIEYISGERLPFETQIVFADICSFTNETVRGLIISHVFLDMSATCKTRDDCEIAQKVFYSLKFKNRPQALDAR